MKKKREPYKKKENKSEIEKKIKYYENIDEDKNIYKYSLSKYNKSTKNANYKCLDTKCEGEISITFEIIKIEDHLILKP